MQKDSAWTPKAVSATAQLIGINRGLPTERLVDWIHTAELYEPTGHGPVKRFTVHQAFERRSATCPVRLAFHFRSILLEYPPDRAGRGISKRDGAFPRTSDIHQRQNPGGPVNTGAYET